MLKKIIIIVVLTLVYQSPILSKSNSFDNFNSKNLSKYFSGIVAFENENNSKALDFFNSSKILINRHDPYLKRLVMSLVLEDKILQATNFIKSNSKRRNSHFLEAYILLALDSLKKKDISKAIEILSNIPDKFQKDRIDFIIIQSLIDYSYVFKNKKIKEKTNNFGDLSLISEAFQRCFLDDKNTDNYFSSLINNKQADYSRYIFFYVAYLIEKKRIDEAKLITDNLDYISTTLLLSQGKAG